MSNVGVVENSDIEIYCSRLRLAMHALSLVPKFDNILLGVPDAFTQSAKALQMKHAFCHEFFRHPHKFEVGSSGLPSFAEMSRLHIDKIKVDENGADQKDYRSDMIDSVFKNNFPYELRFKQAVSVYQRILASKKPMLFHFINPKWNKTDSNFKNISWMKYDHVTHLPVIYHLEYSVGESDDVNLPKFLFDNSLYNYKLVTIGSSIIEKFDIKIRSLSRYTIGPLCYKGMDNGFEDIFNQVNDGWMLTISHEKLTSSKTEKIKDGIFRTKDVSIFDIDTNSQKAIDSGATIVENDIIIPYNVYQFVGNNILAKKHVYDDGKVISV